MKKIRIIIFLSVIALALSACTSNALSAHRKSVSSTSTQSWKSTDSTTAYNSFNQATGQATEDFSEITVSNIKGKENFAFLRLPLQARWLSNEVVTARLYLRLKSGKLPKALKIGAATGAAWVGLDSRFTQIKSDIGKPISTSVKSGKNGWLSLDVTSTLKNWLAGHSKNNGFSLVAIKGSTSTFYTGDTEKDNASRPYLVVTGKQKARASNYGKYAFTSVPKGNCLSNALRDTNEILLTDLKGNPAIMSNIYKKSGENGIANYIADLTEKYVATHQQSLKISKFRRLAHFDSSIDAKKEYRIALRVGVKSFDGSVDFRNPDDFDYHWQTELSDGQWAQKFSGNTPSFVLPCSGPGISPARYPWDSSDTFIDKTVNFYTSQAIYFAVTKDVPNFTAH
ncbi:DNRLRE domain-containing protein [Lactococcus nasutitermitis]|uniref:DNRLRE domain-containing protein n=1 Tax=Lactococcus nasutitermitis TaxID=1652957 RepID=A0ABV9JFL6_9LACT|nr:DNRLRE domain-containing protein [Lactococcus nasutitermitis]